MRVSFIERELGDYLSFDVFVWGAEKYSPRDADE